VTIYGHLLSIRGHLPVAVIEDHFWRPLDQQKLLATGAFVERRHEAVLRLKRDGVDPRICCSLRFPVHSKLRGEGIKRSFRRITFHLPDAFLLEQLSIVAEHRYSP